MYFEADCIVVIITLMHSLVLFLSGDLNHLYILYIDDYVVFVCIAALFCFKY